MNYSFDSEIDLSYKPIEGKTPLWFYNENYSYWTMSYNDKLNSLGERVTGVISIGNDGIMSGNYNATYITSGTIRPVVLLKKRALSKKNNYSSSNNNSSNSSSKGIENKTNNEKITVFVPDTLTEVSVLSIVFGLIIFGTCVTLYIYIINRGKNEKNN